MSLLSGVALKAAGLGANLLGPWRLYAEAAVVAVLLSAVGAQTWRLHTSQANEGQARAEAAATLAAWNKQVADGVRLALAETDKQRAIERQRDADQREIIDETQRIAARNRAAAPAARAAHDQLLDRAAAAVSAAGGGEGSRGPAAAGSGPPAAGAGLVLVGVLDRVDLVAGDLAAALDEARTAGLACERAYDSLTP